MAEAMIKGLLRERLVEPGQLVAAGPRQERCTDLAARYHVETTVSNRVAAEGSAIVVLSIKPQVFGAVLAELHNRIAPGGLVLSIAAGVPIPVITQGLNHMAVVRAMPNTPAQIGEGITVWTATEAVTESQLESSIAVLGALGEVLRVEQEIYLDMATALSGTGPAYVLLFMEAMIDAGVHMGFPRRIAERLVMQTMRGTV